jgi:uncharacterized repeat protein (TIGR01451 family)
MAFDKAGNLYVTNFDADSITELDPTGAPLRTIRAGIPAGSHPESLVFDTAGDAFVGLADGNGAILKFDPSWHLVATYQAATDDRGTDWVDLSSDQHTLDYTSEGDSIKRFDTAANRQLPNFVSGLPGTAAFAHRILADGGELAADSQSVLRLDASGKVVKTYTSPDPKDTHLFALNLDPDGTTFWTADANTSHVLRFNIATGAVVDQFTGPLAGPMQGARGLIVKGELLQAQRPSADLSTLALNPTATGTVGQPQTVTFRVSNAGPSDAPNATLTATLPPGLTLDGSTPNGTLSGRTLTIPLGTPAMGTTESVSIVVTPTVAGVPLTIAASAASAIGDPNIGNNTATSAITAANPSADLAIVAVNPPTSGLVGQDLTLTFRVTSSGPDSVSSATATLTWPAGLAMVGSNPVAAVSGSTWTIALGPLAKGATRTFTVTVRPTIANVPLTTQVVVSSALADPTPGDNRARVTVTASSDPTVGVSPRVVAVTRQGIHRQPTVVVLAFDAPLDPARADDPGNYAFVHLVNGHPHGTVAVGRAVYDPSTRTVTLYPVGHLNLHWTYLLTVNGSPATGLTDPTGVPLDGAGDGRPGTDFAYVLQWFGGPVPGGTAASGGKRLTS